MRTVTAFNPQISPSSPALASLSFLGHPAIDHRSDGLRMAKNHRRTRKVRTKQSRRMSFVVEHPALTMPLTDLMGRRPGDINRRTP
jgi:hypothetical protein